VNFTCEGSLPSYDEVAQRNEFECHF